MEKVILEVPLLKSVYVNRHLLGIDPSESWCWTQKILLFFVVWTVYDRTRSFDY